MPEKCASGPPPRPQLAPNRDGFSDLGSAPLPGARALGPGATGIRPRADGNPAPSRRKSGPEPTEIRPRADGNPTPSRRKSCPDPDPLPPFKNTYLTHFPFGSDAARPPLTPISKSFTRSRFAVSYVYATDSKFQCMQLTIHSYFARHICKQIVHAISVRRVLCVCY